MTTVDSPGRSQRVEDLRREELQLITTRASDFAATDTGIDDPTLTSNWMRRTGWARTFKDADRALLQRLCEPPCPDGAALDLGKYGDWTLRSDQRDESRLLLMGHATDRFFDRCEDTAYHTDHSIRCWLRGQLRNQPYKAPFELPAQKSTRSRYRRTWKRLTCFIFRLYRLDATARRVLLAFQFTEEQRVMLKQTWESDSWDFGPSVHTDLAQTSLPTVPSSVAGKSAFSSVDREVSAPHLARHEDPSLPVLASGERILQQEVALAMWSVRLTQSPKPRYQKEVVIPNIATAAKMILACFI